MLLSNCIDYFNIGLNPSGDKIYEYLHNHSYRDEDMLKTGICRMTDAGIRDVFYERIIFPIHNKDGDPIAFTARDYLGVSDSKYINSNDNIIYTKGDNLYNFHRAKDAARKAGYVLVCEGVMDVIAYHRADKDNVVATLGTACTRNQIDLLKALSHKIVLSYDGDRAGQAANFKIGQVLLKEGLNVYVVDNQSELDPDEIINQYGKNALRDMEARQITFIDYAFKYYRKQYNLDNYEDRKKMAFAMSELIELLHDDYDKDNYYNELYELTKIRKRTAVTEPKVVYNKKIADISFSVDGLTKAEYTILTQIALSRKALDIYERKLGCLLDENNQKLSLMIVDDYRKHGECSLSRIYDESNDENIRNIISGLALFETLPTDFDETALNGAIDKVKLEIKRHKMEDLKEKISRTAQLYKNEAYEYLKEYEKLVKELGGNND